MALHAPPTEPGPLPKTLKRWDRIRDRQFSAKCHLGSRIPTFVQSSGMGFDEWVIGLNSLTTILLEPQTERSEASTRAGLGSIPDGEAIAFLKKSSGLVDRRDVHGRLVPVPARSLTGSARRFPVCTRANRIAGYYREIRCSDQQVGRLRMRSRAWASAREYERLRTAVTRRAGRRKHRVGRDKKASIYEGGLRRSRIIEWPARNLRVELPYPCQPVIFYPLCWPWLGVESYCRHIRSTEWI